MPAPDPLADAPHRVCLEAAGLTRRYGPRRAVAGVDLILARGEFLTIFGPNGAGKTTLLKLVAGLVRPTAGTLRVLGMDPRAEPEAIKRRLGLIAHATLLYAGLTARDNLLFYARLYDVGDAAARADALLEQVGLRARADDLVRTYSRGMQQRLSIARALIHEPELVLLDEPYTGLDQHAARMLRALLDQVRGRGRTVMMVTHHLEEGLEVSTRIAVMSQGRLAAEVPAASLTRASLEQMYLQVVGGAAA